MKITLCARVAGGEAGDTVTKDAKYARWLIEQGYAVAASDADDEQAQGPAAERGGDGRAPAEWDGEHTGDDQQQVDDDRGDERGDTTTTRDRRTTKKQQKKNS